MSLFIFFFVCVNKEFGIDETSYLAPDYLQYTSG